MEQLLAEKDRPTDRNVDRLVDGQNKQLGKETLNTNKQCEKEMRNHKNIMSIKLFQQGS